MPASSFHFALLCAAGGTGGLVLQQAFDAGHRVTALVRTPSKLARSRPHLDVVQGSALDRECADQTIRGVDAVICTLGAPLAARSACGSAAPRWSSTPCRPRASVVWWCSHPTASARPATSCAGSSCRSTSRRCSWTTSAKKRWSGHRAWTGRWCVLPTCPMASRLPR